MVANVVDMKDIGAGRHMLAKVIGRMVVPEGNKRNLGCRPEIDIASFQLRADAGITIGKSRIIQF